MAFTIRLAFSSRPYVRPWLVRSAASLTHTSTTIDTLIVGGGPVGLSTAYHLATSHRENDGSSITIVERDPTYCRASATLSVSSTIVIMMAGRFSVLIHFFACASIRPEAYANSSHQSKTWK